MPSFDIVSEVNEVEIRNAVEQTNKEVSTRFDFKGTSAAVELKDKEITLFGDAEFQLTQVEDLLRNKLTKRNVDVRFLDIGKPQKVGGDKVKQVVKVREGIATEDAKKITRIVKDSKMKVQASIQGDAVRVVLFDEQPGLQAPWLQVIAARDKRMAPFKDCVTSGEPICGRLNPDKMELLFGDDQSQAQSVALIPAPNVGLIAVGSRDGNRFFPGMGTLFLRLMAESFAAALARFPKH